MASVYLDSCMIIGLIEGERIQQHLLKKHLIDHIVYSSDLARLETRVIPLRTQNFSTLQQYDRFFAACTIVPLSRSVCDRATTLRASSNLKTPDALHLAAAIQAQCTELWTSDKQLKNAARPMLNVLDWPDIEAL
ncbi:MAG: type II toxin-antitoxin system VapC family toxin [Cyanobacteria bacterium J06642_2]